MKGEPGEDGTPGRKGPQGMKVTLKILAVSYYSFETLCGIEDC